MLTHKLIEDLKSLVHDYGVTDEKHGQDYYFDWIKKHVPEDQQILAGFIAAIVWGAGNDCLATVHCLHAALEEAEVVAEQE